MADTPHKQIPMVSWPKAKKADESFFRPVSQFSLAWNFLYVHCELPGSNGLLKHFVFSYVEKKKRCAATFPQKVVVFGRG